MSDTKYKSCKKCQTPNTTTCKKCLTPFTSYEGKYMLFNSFSYLIFFPIVVLMYFAIPYKARYLWLLAASYYFYMAWNPKYALLMALSTVITYMSGLLIGRETRLTSTIEADSRTYRYCLLYTSYFFVECWFYNLFSYQKKKTQSHGKRPGPRGSPERKRKRRSGGSRTEDYRCV